MPRFAANLSMLFTEHPFLDRFERAARAGFGAVEFLFPYAHTPGEVAARLKGNKLQCVLHNLPAGDWEAGERGDLAVGRDATARDARHHRVDLLVRKRGCGHGEVSSGSAPGETGRRRRRRGRRSDAPASADATRGPGPGT